MTVLYAIALLGQSILLWDLYHLPCLETNRWIVSAAMLNVAGFGGVLLASMLGLR